jgi:hypothetical protein
LLFPLLSLLLWPSLAAPRKKKLQLLKLLLLPLLLLKLLLQLLLLQPPLLLLTQLLLLLPLQLLLKPLQLLLQLRLLPSNQTLTGLILKKGGALAPPFLLSLLLVSPLYFCRSRELCDVLLLLWV